MEVFKFSHVGKSLSTHGVLIVYEVKSGCQKEKIDKFEYVVKKKAKPSYKQSQRQKHKLEKT